MMNNRTKRSTRFKKTSWIALSLIAACWVSLYAYYGHYSEADKMAYKQLVDGENEENELTQTQISKQRRQGVEKSLFFNSGRHRLELNISSKTSELALEKTDRHVEVVEYLTDVVCRLQEPQQTVLVLKAGSATYHYKGGLFSAKNVQLQRYVNDILIAEGSAESVAFSLSGKNLDFTATSFKGDFDRQEGMMSVAADQVRFQPELVILSGHAVVGHQMRTLTADQMVFYLSEESKKTEKNVIKTIVADGEVHLQDGDFTTVSDHAVFQSTREAREGVLQGTITLTCYSPDTLCRVVNREGDIILSKEIIVNTVKEEAMFVDPKGDLSSVGWSFHANKMVWKESASTLTLSGNVKITSDSGKIEAAREVHMVLATRDGKKVLRGIHADGEVLLTHIDTENGADHTLKSYGSLVVDHQKMDAKLQSPEGGQLFFEDAKGHIFADKAFVKYMYEGKKIVPERIVLQGNAKIENHLERSEADQTKSSQYILSDRVDFIPKTKEMIFKADSGKRVLFFDKDNNLEVSARGMKVIRDKAARKDTIQGIGSVRFNFVTSELEQLRRDFSFDKKNEGMKKS